MNFIDYINLLRRNVIQVVAITTLVVVATIGIIKWKNTTPFQTTIFITIGNNQKVIDETSEYENVESSDHFSETVQGWFKNPDFQKRIQSMVGADISARKQEKQNIVVSFTTDSPEAAQSLNTTIKEELQKEIELYNSKTNSAFQLAIFNENTEEKPLSLILFTFLSVICGISVSLFIVYSYEYLFQLVSTKSQAEEILKTETIEELPNLKPTEEKLHFLATHLQKTDAKNIQIIGFKDNQELLVKTLNHHLKNKNISSLIFPKESAKINLKDHQIIVVILGKTPLIELKKLKKLLSASVDLIIVKV